jgi:hypothetical protein
LQVRRSLQRAVIPIHRWLGVALCLLFLLWFLSGIGMMYWEFPNVSAADRLIHSPALDPDSIRLTVTEAFEKSGLTQPVTGVRLNTFDGRPVYRFRSGVDEVLVYGDDGQRRGEISREMMLRAAIAWTGRPDPPTVESIDDIDQWTIQLRGFRPLWKYTWPSGEHVYVPQSSGEVVQSTTAASRLGAYAGPIPHWLYFTPLRRHGPQWSALVIGLSALGTATAILGIIVGVSVYSPGKRYLEHGLPTRIPYRGPKRWHTMFGLVFGAGAATWAFSGMLSMDPFPLQTDGDRRLDAERLSRALRGNLRIAGFDAKSPRQALRQLADVKVRELELVTVGERPFYLALLGPGDSRIVPVDGLPVSEFDTADLKREVTAIVGSIAHPAIDRLDQYDRYYLDRRHRLPLPVLRVSLDDAQRTRYYIDPKTARVVGSYSSGNWATRWLYHGLHSLDFPWLYNYRPLWDIVVITFMLGGAALSVTSVILAWRVIGRRLNGPA